MSSPEDRERHSKRRQRNFVAKRLRESPQFRAKRIENKKRDEDRENLDWWLKGRRDYEEAD